MKKNILFPGLPVYIWILGILCASCNTSTSPKLDTWSLVTSLNQLDGTWKGVYQQTIAIQEVVDLLDQTGDDTMPLLLDYMKEALGPLGMMDNITWNDVALLLGDMKATISAEITVVIHASEKTQSESVNMTITFSGENIGIIWLLLIKPNLPELIAYMPGTTVDDRKHSITLPEQSTTDQPITEEEIADLLSSGLQINQSGNIIKIPAGTIWEGSSEIIMIKQ